MKKRKMKLPACAAALRMSFVCASAGFVCATACGAEFMGELYWAAWYSDSGYELYSTHVDEWNGEQRFDEYMEVDGVKYPQRNYSANWKEFLLVPVKLEKSGEKFTPVVINGTTTPGEVEVEAMTDSQVYNLFKSGRKSWMADELKKAFPGGVSSSRVWIKVIPGQSKTTLRAQVDLSKRPAAGVYADRSMSDLARECGVNYFTGAYPVAPSTWYAVGIKETGEVLTPTACGLDSPRLYVGQKAYSKEFLNRFLRHYDDMEDKMGGDRCEAVLCEAAWYISAQEAGGAELVVLSDDIRMGTVSGNGIYGPDTRVTIAAKPSWGYELEGWYDGETLLSRDANWSYVTTSEDKTIVARFRQREGEDAFESMAGLKVELDVGLLGYTAKGLPPGLKLNKKTGVVSGTPKKPGTYVATFTKKGEESVTMTFVVAPFPTISISMEGDTEKCKVTGASKPGKGYLVGKKVNLAAKAPKGTAFVGWFRDGEPWPDETTYLAAKQKYVMTEESLSLVARFEREKMSVSCPGLSSPLAVGEEVSIPVEIETQSGVKSVKGSKLPSELKVKKVGDGWTIVGTPKKAGTYSAKVKVTAKSGAVEEVLFVVVVE